MARARETSSKPSPAEAVVGAAAAIVRESDDFTLKEVSRRSGVALETLYRHFASKDELALAVLEHTVADRVEEIVEELGEIADPVERLEELVVNPFRFPPREENRRLTEWRARERQRLMGRFPDAVDSSAEPYLVAIAAALEAARAAGRIETDDVALDALLIQQHVRTVWFELGWRVSGYAPEEVGRRVWEFVSRGLRVRDPVVS
jgi:AcrR family transcriptional regulator